jgi:hypothetical protein
MFCGYAVQMGEAITKGNGYQVIQREIELFKGVPIPIKWIR